MNLENIFNISKILIFITFGIQLKIMIIKFNNLFLSIKSIGFPDNPNFYCIYFSKAHPDDFGVDNNWLWFKKNKGLGDRVFMLMFGNNHNPFDEDDLFSLTFTRFFTLICSDYNHEEFELPYNHDLDDLILKIYNYLLHLV